MIASYQILLKLFVSTLKKPIKWEKWKFTFTSEREVFI